MTRLADAWRALTPEQRLCALASLGLFVSMLLPWYDKTDTLVVHGAAKATETSLSAFQAFSFVEAAVLLVSAGVLTMLFARAEGRDFRLPGGDGLIAMIAGGWAALLIFYRLLDKPGLQGNERFLATVGVEWGIFIALLLALGVVYAGARMRALERPEPPLRRAGGRAPVPARSRGPLDPPPLDADDTTVVTARRMPLRGRAPVPAREPDAARERGRYPPAPPGQQLSFEDPPASAGPE
ncbi:MAG TPA: hypothetical protein VK778_12100 [Solirubrobacteraceae bacterium]|jgi:hypothetical protein|nr:hypothetical protein [Solirubrobacteraceae bacterium]